MLVGIIVLSTAIVLVAIGLYGLMSSRNIIRTLLSSEILLNASILFVFALSYLRGLTYQPVIYSVFAISMALIEVVVAFAAVILYFRSRGTLEVD